LKTLSVAFAAASFVAFAALVGWLKTVYFFRPFGVSPAALEFGWVSASLASWYVVQNTVYFGAVVWLVVQTRRFALAMVALVYALIPLASHYGFLFYDHAGVRFWVDHQHTWLKLVPVVLLAGLVLGRLRGSRPDWRWRHGRRGRVLFAIVIGSWGLSAAKHFGSYDAERILHLPEELLPRVELSWKGPPPGDWSEAPLYLLHEDTNRVVVVEFRAGERWKRRTPRVRSIPHPELRQVVVSPPGGVQPGGQFL